MSDLSQWAKDKAREIQGKMCRCPEKRVQDAAECPDCLAELLVEVVAEQRQSWRSRMGLDCTVVPLAEVRRVVEYELPQPACPCCEGQGTHDAECTFAEDAPSDFDDLRIEWERYTSLLARLEKL